jgi:transposase InsO family protein
MNSKARKLLHKIYYDPSHSAGFSTIDKVWKATNKMIPKMNVQQWLESQDSFTLHQSRRKNFDRNRFLVNYIDDVWQADLCDMQSLSKYNDNFKYMLTVIDIFSKFAWIVVLRNKTSGEIIRGFEEIFLTSNRKPTNLNTDKGREFKNKPFQSLLKEKGINFYHTNNPDTKAAVVERFNKTIKNQIYKYFTFSSTYRYIDVLPDLLHSYNNSIHSTIKMAPADVNIDNMLQVWQTLNDRVPIITKRKNKFAVGEHVRISRDKTIFEKGFEKNWSDEVFIISEVLPRRHLTVYRIEDMSHEPIEGTFYEIELKRVQIEKSTVFKIDKIVDQRKIGRSTQLLVKWLGYPSSQNSWVKKSDIIHLL